MNDICCPKLFADNLSSQMFFFEQLNSRLGIFCSHLDHRDAQWQIVLENSTFRASMTKLRTNKHCELFIFLAANQIHFCSSDCQRRNTNNVTVLVDETCNRIFRVGLWFSGVTMKQRKFCFHPRQRSTQPCQPNMMPQEQRI